MLTVLKLGGSVITEKDEPETVDESNLARAADAVADAVADVEDDLVLVHGGGSFGHARADALGASVTEGLRDPAGIREIHESMRRLNDAVLDALHTRDVPALPVDPLSSAHRGHDGELTLPPGTVDAMVGEGFVPVLHGDVVVHAGKGATVLSGDELVASLASALGADRVGLCSAVPGVLADYDGCDVDDGDGEGTRDREAEVIGRVRSFEDVADVLGESEATDVTGGMEKKVRELLNIDAPAQIFGLDDLPAFVAGDSPGTRIE